MRRIRLGLSVLLLVTVVALVAAAADPAPGRLSYLPLAYRTEPTPTPTPTPTPPPTGVEFRGLWVTRFDWTVYGQPANPAKIDEIVQNAAAAGFNVILFQVRGAADAYYAPGYEPWAQRVSGGQLGQPPSPWWDPLAYFVAAAHARGLQLHAYINVYPVWDQCDTAPPYPTTPTHFYYLLKDYHGTTNDKLNGLQWDTSNQIHCSIYQRSSPASMYADDHYLNVARDLVTRYDIDGIHLDNIRYGGSNTSCDPVSEWSEWGYGADCFSDGGYAGWQRAQVNGTVWKFYDQIVPLKAGLWLTAAVWPIYINYWGWPNAQEGYYDYFQDSKAWLQGGYIDSIMPMIYGTSFWTLSRWIDLVSNYQSDNYGRYIIPGIGANFDTFDEIANRIAEARAIGTAGHAIFSYGNLASWGYFDDLAAGPYAAPAAVPTIGWHN